MPLRSESALYGSETSDAARPEDRGRRRRRGAKGRAQGLLGLPPVTSLDAQLGQRAGERPVDGRDFLIGDLVAQAGRGALARFRSPGFVDIPGRDGHVRDDGDAAAGDLDESFAHTNEIVVTVL